MNGRFGARTIMIPLISVFGFYTVQIVVLVVYLVAISVIRFDIFSGIDLFDPSVILRSPHIHFISILYSLLIASLAAGALAVLKQKNTLAIRLSASGISGWVAAVTVVLGLAGITYIQMSVYVALGEYSPLIQGALERYYEISQGFTGTDSIWLVIVSTCILVPVAEELVFRGLIQGELRRAMPAAVAVIIQAVIFTLVHGNPIQMSYVLLPALLFGAIYEWTGSLYIPIGLHMIFNFTGSALPMMLEDHSVWYSTMVFILVSLIPAGILSGLFLYTRYTRRTKTDHLLTETLLSSTCLNPPPLTTLTTETDEVCVKADRDKNIWIHKDLIP